MKFKSSLQVHVIATEILKETSTLHFFSCDMSKYGYTPIGVVEIEFEAAPADVVHSQVEIITQEIKRVQQEATAKVANLEASINNLLCLEA